MAMAAATTAGAAELPRVAGVVSEPLDFCADGLLLYEAAAGGGDQTCDPEGHAGAEGHGRGGEQG